MLFSDDKGTSGKKSEKAIKIFILVFEKRTIASDEMISMINGKSNPAIRGAVGLLFQQ